MLLLLAGVGQAAGLASATVPAARPACAPRAGPIRAAIDVGPTLPRAAGVGADSEALRARLKAALGDDARSAETVRAALLGGGTTPDGPQLIDALRPLGTGGALMRARVSSAELVASGLTASACSSSSSSSPSAAR